MMDYDFALGRLWNHACMPAPEHCGFTAEESFVYNLRMSTETNAPVVIAPFLDDIITCLEVVNVHINGSPPSEGSMGLGPIDRRLSVTMAGIVHDAWQYHWLWEHRELFEKKNRGELARAAWSISRAWTFVLHGDIDSISEDLEYQYMALEIRDFEVH
jgi:hypothetical protein